jgi:cyclophilin family peptidyl-prolyl cis-trans isomerase
VVVAVIVIAIGWYTYGAYFVKPVTVLARIDTTYGPIEVQLFPDCAPLTVANFVRLANSSFYDNLVWHRIVPHFVIQTGDPNTKGGINSSRTTWGRGGSNQTVPLETCSRLHHYRGYLGMASGANITSQFFINLNDSNSGTLDGRYTVFGQVTSGMDVVDRIAGVPVNSQSQPVTPVFMTDVVILKSQ